MSNLPYFKFYTSDFLGGTRTLTGTETLVYTILLVLIYDNNGPILNDPVILARACKVKPSSFSAALESLVRQGKITVVGDRLTNDRAEEELSRRSTKSEVAKSSAKTRWESQAQKTSQNQRPVDANALRMQSDGDANHSSESIGQSSDTPPTPPGGAAQLDLGDQPPAPKPKRKAQFPSDWRPSADLVAYAQSQGIAPHAVGPLAEACVDYHRSRGNTFLDHDAAFRTWVRNEVKRRPSAPPSQPRSYSQPRRGEDDDGRPVWMGAITRQAVEEMRRAKAERDAAGGQLN